MNNKFVSGLPGPDLSRRRTIEQTLLDVRRFNEAKKIKKGLVTTTEKLITNNDKEPERPFSVEEEEEALFKAEQVDAEDWYENHTKRERAQAARAAAWARRDHLLSDDDLPF